MTPSGIETVTFRFVAQHLNHCATCYEYYICNVTYQKDIDMRCSVPEDDTDVPEHAAVVKDRILKCIFNLCIVLVSQMNTVIHV